MKLFLSIYRTMELQDENLLSWMRGARKDEKKLVSFLCEKSVVRAREIPLGYLRNVFRIKFYINKYDKRKHWF